MQSWLNFETLLIHLQSLESNIYLINTHLRSPICQNLLHQVGISQKNVKGSENALIHVIV